MEAGQMMKISQRTRKQWNDEKTEKEEDAE